MCNCDGMELLRGTSRNLTITSPGAYASCSRCVSGKAGEQDVGFNCILLASKQS